jgi:excisionase family DNA binding protein
LLLCAIMKKDSFPLASATGGWQNFPDRPMSVAELADWLGVSRRFLETQIEKGSLRVRRISPRCIRILPVDVAHWLEQTATTDVDA